MAITMTLTAATPNRLKYAVAYDGAGGANSAYVQKLQAELVADAKTASGHSPLAALLESIDTNGPWIALAQSAELSIYCTVSERPSTGTFAPAGLDVDLSDGRILSVLGVDGESYAAIVELVYNITPSR